MGIQLDERKKRVKSKTLNFRWTIRNGEKILQQQFVIEDEVWIDWQGPHPEYYWEDVPTLGEFDDQS